MTKKGLSNLFNKILNIIWNVSLMLIKNKKIYGDNEFFNNYYNNFFFKFKIL